MKKIELCPCGSGELFQRCCQPYLDEDALPRSPEQLMRSRYSAFCTGNIDYLIATHHPSQHKADDRKTLANTIATTEWLGLRLLNSAVINEAAGLGRVEFVAFYQSKGRVEQLHERSEFLRQNGRWFYLKGDFLPPIALGRNDPCWCGSGKKVKQCHGG